MAAIDSLKDIYKKMENKYYDILDSIQNAGIPIYKVVDAVEAQNIPTFPIVGILCLIIASLAVLFVAAIFFPWYSQVTIIIQDSSGNPIEGATVTIKLYDEVIATETTNEDGIVIGGILYNEEYTIEVEKSPDYDSETKTFTATKAEEEFLITLTLAVTPLNRTIRLLKPGTNELVTTEVEVFFNCSDTEFSPTETTSNGIIELEIPSNCGILNITPRNGYSTMDDAFNVSTTGGTYEVHLEGADLAPGTVVVQVNDLSGNAIAGIDVSLVAATDSGNFGGIIATKQTPSSGGVTFSGITPGRYYITTYDSTSNYAEYDSLGIGDIKELQPEGSIDFTVVLERSVVGAVKLVVKDKETLAAISGATVTLSKDGGIISTQQTDSEGKVEFSVGENVGYEITVDKSGYLIETLSNLYPGVDYREVLLEKATAENSQSLTVTVIDEYGNPVEDTRLRLKKPDGTVVGSEIVTGANGVAVFERVQEGDYYVYAYKPGYGEDTSLPITLSERLENTLEIELRIGTGSLEISVLDESLQPVAGANIKVVNFFTHSTIAEEITGADGFNRIDVRADKFVYVVVEASGYMPYTTIPIQMVKDNTIEVEANLVRDISEFKLEFIGLFVGEELVRDSLNSGQRYKAKFKLTMPKGSTFTEAGVHIRTGAEDSEIMERDSLYIADATSAYKQILKGTSYNPPTGYATDAEHLTTGNAKWVNMIIDNPSQGIYEIEAEIQVSEAARRGSILDLWYRAWGKAGGYVRYPEDRVLGTSESVGEKQALYAQAKNVKYTVGPSTLCIDDFCAVYTIDDLTTNLQTAVIDEYPARISGNYKLGFNISSIAESTYPSAELQIVNESSSIALEEYNIVTPKGEQRAGNADGSELTITLGDLEENDVTVGTVNFRTKNEGTTYLTISIVSGSVKVYEKKIRIQISAANEMNVEILPKIIVPYINNNLLIKVTDENGSTTISNATVSIKKDGTIIASGETDAEGVFGYTLLAPSAGAVIGVRVEKNGFRTVEMETVISESILTATPAELKDNLIIGTASEKDIDLSLQNLTLIPLVIEKIEESGDFDDYVLFDFDDDLIGYEINVNGDANLSGSIAIGDRGLTINEPKTIEGSISVYVTNSEFQKTWTTRIPTEIRIGFGEEVDDSDCFNLFPTNWEIFTSTESKTLEVTVNNNCKVGGEPISLRDFKARILLGNENSLGSFQVSSNIEGSRQIQLTSSFQTIADFLPAEEGGTITIEFLPANIVSGSAEIELEFVAVNLIERGEDPLSEEIETVININDLAECVEVEPDQLRIDSCPYNVGYGNYGQHAGYFGGGFYGGYGTDGGTYRQYDPYQASYGYGTGNPPYVGTYTQLGNAYPYSSYHQPYYGSDYYAGSLDYSWGCGGAKLRITNNCASSVDVDLDVDSGLMIEQDNVTVEPGEETEVDVQAAYMVGQFPIDVEAKVSGSDETPTEIKTVSVIVENELTRTYKDCISVSPSRTLKFNNFIRKPVTLKVINNCYNSGVRLLYSNDTISFGGRSLAATTEIGPSDVEMINYWAIIGESFESSADGTVTQILEFEIMKNLQEYRNKAPPWPREGTTFQQIGNLRYFFTSGYHRVQERATLTVNFTNRWGGRSGIKFPMIIEDWWAGLEHMERMRSYGDPNYSPRQCIKPDAMNWRNYYRQSPGQCIPPEELYREFSTTETGGLMKFAQQQQGQEKGGCGTVDTVSDLEPDVFTVNGVIFDLTIVDDHEIEMRIDASRWDGKSNVVVDKTVYATVTRVVPASHARVPIRIKLCIQGEGVAPPPVTVETCEQGETGNAYQQYGFDHLLFEWRNGEIKKDSCDASTNTWQDDKGRLGDKNLKDSENKDKAYFCDAAQFGLALNEKVEVIKDVVDDIGDAACKVEGVEEEGCKAYKKSTEIHRFVKEAVSVHDDVLPDNEAELVFFKKADNELLENKIDKETMEKVGRINQIIEAGTQYQEIIDWSQEVLDELAVSKKETGKNIVALVNTKEFEEANKTTLPHLGAENIWGDYYVWTFNEYRTFHRNIVNALKTTDSSKSDYCNKEGEEATTCYIVAIDDSANRSSGKVEVTHVFLSKIYKEGAIKFIAGIRSKQVMEPEERDAVLKDAKTRGGISLPSEYNSSFLRFYYDIVDFNALLIEDGYSEDFRADFKRAYDISLENWTFKAEGNDGGMLSDAGKQSVKVDYDWSGDSTKVNVEIALADEGKLSEIDEKTNEEYARNFLFYMPIDGQLGLEDDDYKRAGYGTVFKDLGRAYTDGMLYIVHYKTEDVFDVKAYTNSGEEGNITVDYQYRYSVNEPSRILSIDSQNLVFSPKDPTPIKVKIEKTRTGETAAGLLYKLDDGVTEVGGPKLLDWVVVSDSISGSSPNSAVADQQYNVGSLCSNLAGIAGNVRHGVLVQGNRGTIEMKTIAYMPVRTAVGSSLTVRDSTLEIICSKDSLTGTYWNDRKGTFSGASPNGSATINLTGADRRDMLKNEYTLKKLVEDIKDKKVCVETGSADSKSLKLYWNPEYFYEKIE